MDCIECHALVERLIIAVSAYHRATSNLLGLAGDGLTAGFCQALLTCRRRHGECEQAREDLRVHRHAVRRSHDRPALHGFRKEERRQAAGGAE
jgi:hypothetical protein